ncbi:MAG: SIR2 family NAD-dependent protein deacylase [Treponema sp.]
MKETKQYTKAYLIKEKIENVDAILVGIVAGMSTAAGLEYSGERFDKYFYDFKEKYGIKDMYEGGFYTFETLEEYWAWWSRHIYYNRYDVEAGLPYTNLLKILKNKNYFILTTNVDHQIQKAGFDKQRLFYMQGDYGLWQCSTPCHNKTYDNEERVRKMLEIQRDMHIPSSLIPYCPICKKPMTMNLRIDDGFVQDEGWYKSKERYNDFLEKYKNANIMFLELGVGSNTPAIIKYPFMQMTIQNENAIYVSINKEDFYLPKAIQNRSVILKDDINKVLEEINISK